MQALVNWIAGRPWTVVLLNLLLGLAAAWVVVDPQHASLRVRIDPSIESLLPPDSPERAIDQRVRRAFGESETIIVAVQPRAIFTPEGMALAQRLTQRYQQLPEVTGVLSLATAPNMVSHEDELDVRSFTQQAQDDPALVAGFAEAIAAHPLYRNTLVSSDGRKLAFALLVPALSEQRFLKLGFDRLLREATREVAGDVPVYITGTVVGRAATARALLDALKFTVPAVFVIVLALLLLAFRNLRATLAAALTVALTLLWTAATAVLLKVPVNLVTAIVPALVLTLALSFTIYLLAAHFDAQSHPRLGDRGTRTRWVLNRAGLGLTLSAGTTAASFLALTLNDLPAIRHFAVLASLGSAYGVWLSLSFLPSLLALLNCGRPSRPPPASLWFERFGDALARFDQKWRTAIIAVALIAIPVNSIFASRVQAGAEFSRSFAKNSEVRRDFETINRDFDGANLLSILIETHVNDALTDPASVRRIDELQNWLRAQPEVGAVVSYVDHLKLINRAFGDASEDAVRIPDTAAAIKQLLVFGGSDAIRHLIDPRFRSALITLRVKVDSSAEIEALVARIDQRLAAMPQPLDGVVSGSPLVASRMVRQIASGQFESIALATVLIWMLLALMFTSARAGLVALLPTVVPVAIYFGTLGLLDIPLSPTTALVACIVIGIAVDDTIQFMARFNLDARARGDEAPAVGSALRAILRPVTLSTVALCSGFLVFAGSSLNSQVQFGLLSAFTLFLAWLMNITLTPALSSKLRIVTWWDILRLDLGEAPQLTIPLLAGLSLRQARVFALMSKLEKYPAGALVIREGDVARDIYVVVDGQLEAWVQRQGEHRRLSTMGRGAVMGEAGYFGQRRTANVQALSAVRVLRFDHEDLERLRERYPRIAALVLRNLNRAQAERLARATAMLE